MNNNKIFIMINILFLIFFFLLSSCSGSFFIGNRPYIVRYFYKDRDYILLARNVLKNDKDQIISLVNQKNLDVNKIGANEMTFLYLSIIKKNYDAFETLIDLGADVNYTVEDGPSLMYLVMNSENEFLLKALENNGDPNFGANIPGRQSLLYNGILSEIPIDKYELLLKFGANPNYSTRSIDNVLRFSIFCKRYDYSKILLKNNADPFITDEIKSYILEDLKKSKPSEIKDIEIRNEVVKMIEDKYNVVIELDYPDGYIIE